MTDNRPPVPPSDCSSAPITLVIAGRPNVGKSTLFNRLARKKLAIVADYAGVTRDRKDLDIDLFGRQVRLVDTAGLDPTMPKAGEAITLKALSEASLILFVIDAKAGITPQDKHYAAGLRRFNRPLLLVANKTEGRKGAEAALLGYELGLSEPLAVSAEHNEGISELLRVVATFIAEKYPLPPQAPAEDFPDEITSDSGEEPETLTEDIPKILKLAIIGRPNTGKSTLLNQILGEERVITGPEPGLTRDAISSQFTDKTGQLYELVDTAGLRRRARIEENLEKMAVQSSLQALKMAEIVILTLDATEGVTDQDLTLARLIESEGRSIILVLNKWDQVKDRKKTRQDIADDLARGISQLKGVTQIPLSALTGENLDALFPALQQAYKIWTKRVTTGALNRWFEEATSAHPPPVISGGRIKLRYITQRKARPPTFMIFGSRTEETPPDYRRYLVNSLRNSFQMPGTPIRLTFKSAKNPYSDKDK